MPKSLAEHPSPESVSFLQVPLGHAGGWDPKEKQRVESNPSPFLPD